MKTTGLIVMLVGVAVALFSGIALVAAQSPEAGGTLQASSAGTPSLVWPMAVAVLAIAGGGALMAFGGRGYLTTKNPAVRN
jgi:hypothetical protein